MLEAVPEQLKDGRHYLQTDLFEAKCVHFGNFVACRDERIHLVLEIFTDGFDDRFGPLDAFKDLEEKLRGLVQSRWVQIDHELPVKSGHLRWYRVHLAVSIIQADMIVVLILIQQPQYFICSIRLEALSHGNGSERQNALINIIAVKAVYVRLLDIKRELAKLLRAFPI